MLDLITAAVKFQATLDEHGFRNCIIGGLALQAWGELRLTRDMDFSVLTGFSDERAAALAGLVELREPNGLQFALNHRVILGLLPGSISVDIGLAAFDYEKRMLDRSISFDFGGGMLLRICSPEDLIINKVFAGRARDLADVEGILLRRGGDLDWNLIENELKPLLEAAEAPDRMQWLQSKRH